MNLKDQSLLKADFTNFIGALLVNSSLEPRGARHDVLASLMQESLNIAKNEDKSYDFYVLKPLFRANKIILNDHTLRLKKDIETAPSNVKSKLKVMINNCEEVIGFYDEIIKSLDRNIDIENKGDIND